MVKSMETNQLRISGNISSLQTKHILTLLLWVKATFYESGVIDMMLKTSKKGRRKLVLNSMLQDGSIGI
jgi:hypothetical protein